MTRYELLDRIGKGGMAEIFRGKAVGSGGFEKPVAIKRILPHLSKDQRFVELLIAEAKVLSQLRHRNIVQIFDVGLGDDQQYFLVMEFVDGRDLAAVRGYLSSARTRLPIDIALHIGAELCDALGHAHAAKGADGAPMRLVHRDVAPSNILLSRAGEVKLTDFGIAKRAEEVTGHGAVRGKFAYVSPEQAKNQHVDPRSDVFSAGILLWELLTGKPLYSELSDIEALRSICEREIPAPSSVEASVPREVDELIAIATAKAPDQRFASALAFGGKLRTLRYNLPNASGDPAADIGRAVEQTIKAALTAPSAPSPLTEPAVTPPLARPPTVAAAGHAPVLRNDFEGNEATVIRIRTADAFATGGNDIAALSRARQVIERFEEEETRMAQLSPQMRKRLRAAESAEMTAFTGPPAAPGLPGVAAITSTPRSNASAPPTTRSAPRPPPSEDFGADEPTHLAFRQPHPISGAPRANPFGDERTAVASEKFVDEMFDIASRTPAPIMVPHAPQRANTGNSPWDEVASGRRHSLDRTSEQGAPAKSAATPVASTEDHDLAVPDDTRTNVRKTLPDASPPMALPIGENPSPRRLPPSPLVAAESATSLPAMVTAERPHTPHRDARAMPDHASSPQPPQPLFGTNFPTHSDASQHNATPPRAATPTPLPQPRRATSLPRPESQPIAPPQQKGHASSAGQRPPSTPPHLPRLGIDAPTPPSTPVPMPPAVPSVPAHSTPSHSTQGSPPRAAHTAPAFVPPSPAAAVQPLSPRPTTTTPQQPEPVPPDFAHLLRHAAPGAEATPTVFNTYATPQPAVPSRPPAARRLPSKPILAIIAIVACAVIAVIVLATRSSTHRANTPAAKAKPAMTGGAPTTKGARAPR